MLLGRTRARTSRPGFPLNAEGTFDPDGKRVRDELRVGGRPRPVRFGNSLGKSSDETGIMRVSLRSDAPERFADDMLRPDRHAEKLAGHRGDLSLLLSEVPRARERGRCANALQVRRVEELADPANQHRHVRSLSPSIGVQLVQHQELKTLGRLDERPLLWSGEDQFQHDVVRQQDVGRLARIRSRSSAFSCPV